MKRKCVLGVLKTELGLKIKEEMLAWLSPLYDVITVEQEVPGVLYEYPALAAAAKLSMATNEPVLYLHTKGAAMPNNAQPLVREFWKREFGRYSDKYFEKANVNKPVVVAPITGTKNRVCWFNGYVMNPQAAKFIDLVITTKSDRMWFEQGILNEANVKTIGLLDENAEVPEVGFKTFLRHRNNDLAVVAMLKNEEEFICEWLTYHAKLGVKHFFLIDNNDEGSTALPDTLEKNNMRRVLADLGASYQILDYRGREKLARAGFQNGIYNTLYNSFVQQGISIKWLAFIDIDEFLYFDGKTAEEFLSQDTIRYADVIHFNWQCYGDNGLIYKDSRPVLERFTTPSKIDVMYNTKEQFENKFVKSIVQVRNRYAQVMAHTTHVQDGLCVRADGTVSKCQYAAEFPISHKGGCVKHFNTKSLQEYIERKCNVLQNIADNQFFNVPDRLVWYFNQNEKTPEKVAYIKEKLGIDV